MEKERNILLKQFNGKGITLTDTHLRIFLFNTNEIRNEVAKRNFNFDSAPSIKSPRYVEPPSKNYDIYQVDRNILLKSFYGCIRILGYLL